MKTPELAPRGHYAVVVLIWLNERTNVAHATTITFVDDVYVDTDELERRALDYEPADVVSFSDDVALIGAYVSTRWEVQS